MDEEKSVRTDPIDVVVKTILIIILIFGLLIGCIYLYLWSFIERVRKMEAENASARAATETAIDEDYARESRIDEILGK